MDFTSIDQHVTTALTKVYLQCIIRIVLSSRKSDNGLFFKDRNVISLLIYSGNANNCPSRSHPIWEMPINELDRRDDPDFDETLSGCHLVSSCSNVYQPEQFERLLNHNFERLVP